MADATTDRSWSPGLVADRLAEAADVLARLPAERARGFYDLWPRIIGASVASARPAAAAPSPEAIDRMDDALGWLCWLDADERQLVWLRAEGLPWKWITRWLGVGRTTAWQRWTAALLKVSVRLNAVDEQKCSNNEKLNTRRSSVLQSM
jgi:Domain of unknown function (DUF6362)